MTRVNGGFTAKNRRKKLLELAEGKRGRGKKCLRIAKRVVAKGLQYSYRDRKARKRDFRALWIQRINAAAREMGLKYSVLMGKMAEMGVEINRKMLAELSVRDNTSFVSVVKSVVEA